MGKLITFIVMLHIVVGVIAGIYQGSGGYIIHELAVACDDNDLTLTLNSNVNFADDSVVQIGSEYLLVNTVDIDGVTLNINASGRGYWNSTPAAHNAGAQVYSEEAAGVSGTIQARVARIADASGPLAAFDVTAQILGIIGAILVSPFTFFGGDLWIISATYSAILIGLLVVIGITMFGARRI